MSSTTDGLDNFDFSKNQNARNTIRTFIAEYGEDTLLKLINGAFEIEEIEKDYKLLSCNHCGHVWKYKGSRVGFVTCPKCTGNVHTQRRASYDRLCRRICEDIRKSRQIDEYFKTGQ